MKKEVYELLSGMESALIGLSEEKKLVDIMFRYFDDTDISNLGKVDAYNCLEVLMTFLFNELVQNVNDLGDRFYALWDLLKSEE